MVTIENSLLHEIQMFHIPHKRFDSVFFKLSEISYNFLASGFRDFLDFF